MFLVKQNWFMDREKREEAGNICVLTYFFKLYQIFFKSAFLVVCDITIFSKRYHDFFKINFTIFSNGFLNRYQWNKL